MFWLMIVLMVVAYIVTIPVAWAVLSQISRKRQWGWEVSGREGWDHDVFGAFGLIWPLLLPGFAFMYLGRFVGKGLTALHHTVYEALEKEAE